VNKPSLQELVDRAHLSIVAETGQDNPATKAIAAAIAGASFGQYAYQDSLFKNLNPETANEAWLDVWANRFNVDRIPSTPSSGTITFNGVSGVVSVSEGVIVKTEDDNQYQVTETTDSNQSVPVQSVDEGSNQNISVGTEIFLVSAVSGLNPDTITADAISGGSDIEDLEHWRERVVAAFSQRQAVGTSNDYELWAKSAHPDIDFAWILDNTPEVGRVQVYVGQRENYPIVDSGVLSAAQSYIDDHRLAGCHVVVSDPTLSSVDIEINGVTDPTDQSQIQTALENLFKDKMGLRTDLTPSEIVVAITPVTTSFSLVSPVSAQTLQSSELFVLGNIVWS